MNFRREELLMIVELEGEIDFSNSIEIKRNIRGELLGKQKNLILDISNVEFMDSSGVGVFISLLKTVNLKKGKMAIVNPNEEVEFVLRMTKVEEIIPIYKSIFQAKQYMEEICHE